MNYYYFYYLKVQYILPEVKPVHVSVCLSVSLFLLVVFILFDMHVAITVDQSAVGVLV